jgi:hypothetical protein
MGDMSEYDVQGAGTLVVGVDGTITTCGSAHGFHLSVSWGRYGGAGGVIDASEARRLAEDILKALEGYERPERLYPSLPQDPDPTFRGLK